MTDLTEQWKKGELPSGWYWCKCYDEEIKILYYDGDCFELEDPETKNFYFFLQKDSEMTEVLAPVPSYSEYLALQSDSLAKNEAVEINAELEAENAKLKEEYEAECHRSDELEDSLHIAWKDIDKLKEMLTWCAKIMREPAVYIETLEEKERYINNLHKKQQLLYEIDEVLK